MRVLVTGGAGFLGSHVCEFYAKQGHEVVAVDNLTKFELNRTGFDANVLRRTVLERLERWNVALLVKDLATEVLSPWRSGDPRGQFDFIVHCAAQPAMTIAIEQPAFDWAVNVFGLQNVLNFARQTETPVLNCSTIHVYGTGINQELVEEATRFSRYGQSEIGEAHPLLTGHITPLHQSKYAAEVATSTFADMTGIAAVSFRLTGFYGPRQFGGEDHGWVANFAIRTVMERPITVFGTDKQVRDILFVDDVVAAINAWYENGRESGIYNIGGGVSHIISLGECLEELGGIAGKAQTIELQPGREGDLHYFCCDTALARDVFGWEPVVDNRQGLQRLVRWVEENRDLFQEAKR